MKKIITLCALICTLNLLAVSQMPRTQELDNSIQELPGNSESESTDIFEKAWCFDVDDSKIYRSAPEGVTTLAVNSISSSWTAESNRSWLSVEKTNTGLATIRYETNKSPYSRGGTITFNGCVEIMVDVIQEGYVLDISPENHDVGYNYGSVTYSVNTPENWTASCNANWVIVEKMDASTLAVKHYPNLDLQPRSANIYITGDGDYTKIVTLTKAGSPPYINIWPNQKGVRSESGDFLIAIDANIAWEVTSNVSWVNAAAKSSSEITVYYEENLTTAERVAEIRVEGGGAVPQTVTLVQAAADPFLDVSPNTRNVGSESGTTNFSVNSNVSWSVSESTGWLSASKSGESTINISYETNSLTASRSASVTVIGDGGLSETMQVTQSGAEPYLELAHTSGVALPEGGTLIFAVSANVNWWFSDDASWMETLISNDDRSIIINIEANLSTSSRDATVTVQGDGGITRYIIIDQPGSLPYLEVSPNSQSVGTDAGTKTLTVSTNVSWTASDDAAWLETSKAADGKSLTVSYKENLSTNSRSAKIAINGEGGISKSATLTQAGTNPFLDVSPNNQSVESEAGTVSFTINANVSWTASEDASWLKTSTITDGKSITVNYKENLSANSRTANITINGKGDVSESVTLTQAGTDPFLVVTPNSESVDCEAGSISISVNANLAWTVNDDADWLQAVKKNATTINITYEANISADSRTANITAKGEGNITETVTVIQSGSEVYLVLEPDYIEVDNNAGSVSVTVSSNAEWNVDEGSAWISTEKMDAGNLTINYDANESLESRSETITVTCEESIHEITVVQAGNSPNSIDVNITQLGFRFYPNPTRDILMLQPETEMQEQVLVSIYTINGTLVYSQQLFFTGREPVSIDLSGLKRGIYLLQLNGSRISLIEKL